MKIRNAALAAVGLLFCALTSHAQITALEGYVKGTDGKPLNNAQIAIDRLDIKGHWTCKTDKKGHYIYTGLQMGMYTISLMVDGKVADAVGLETKFEQLEGDNGIDAELALLKEQVRGKKAKP